MDKPDKMKTAFIYYFMQIVPLFQTNTQVVKYKKHPILSDEGAFMVKDQLHSLSPAALMLIFLVDCRSLDFLLFLKRQTSKKTLLVGGAEEVKSTLVSAFYRKQIDVF